MRKTLTLCRDSLAELTQDELGAVHGGAVTDTCLTILTCTPPCHTVA